MSGEKLADLQAEEEFLKVQDVAKSIFESLPESTHPAVIISAISGVLGFVLNETSKNKDLEDVRSVMDKLKASILSQLSDAGWE